VSKKNLLTEKTISDIKNILEKQLWKKRNMFKNEFDKSEEKGSRKLSDHIYKIYTKIREIGNFSEYVNQQDFHDGVWFFSDYAYTPFSKKEFFEKIEEGIFSTNLYEFYFPIPGIHNFPTGLKIGYCESIEYSKMPVDIQSHFEMNWKIAYKWNKEIYHLENDFLNHRKKFLFLKLVVNGIRHTKTMEKAERMVDESLHILRYVYQIDIQPFDYLYKKIGSKSIGGIRGFASAIRNFSAGYDPRLHADFVEFTRIFTGTKLTNLEERIKNTIIAFGISTSVRYKPVRLSILCSSLEALVLDKSDRDYLGWKLAERVTFLIKMKKKRSEVNRDIVDLYNKRSIFMHQKSDTANAVSEYDIQYAEFLVFNTMRKFFELKRSGYEVLVRTKGKKSIMEWIEAKKFREKIK